MFNFFHNIVAGIAVGISSVFLLFSGATITPNPITITQPAPQNITQSAQTIQQISPPQKVPVPSAGSQSKPVSLKQVSATSASSKLDLNFLAQVVVKLECGDEWGSGTIIKRNGSSSTIFTNKHVVGSTKICNVYATTLADSSKPPLFKWTAKVSSIDPVADLALLTISNFPSSYPVLLDQNRFCDASEYTPGQHMTAVGYPATVGGDPTQSTLNISTGDISGLDGGGLITKSTAFIDSGSSGGAAISDSNCYFGMPTATFFRASSNTELSGLGEIINIVAIINTSTLSFANLPVGNIADYIPDQQSPQTTPTPSTPSPLLPPIIIITPPVQQKIPPPAPTPPLAISNAQATHIDANSVIITWADNQLSTTDSIEWSKNSDLSNSQIISNIYGAFPTSISKLLPQTTYYFRVVTKNNKGESASSDVLSFQTIAATAPAKFSLTASNITSGSASITLFLISEIGGDPTITGLEYDTSNTFTSPKKASANSFNISGLPITLGGLAKNTMYYYRLGFTDMWGNQFYSDTGSFTTLAQ